MVFQNDILAGASGAAGGGYAIDQSIRFNDNDSAYLSRTFGTPTDATNWTFSAWVKRCNLGTEQWFFNSGASAAAYYIRFESTDKIRFRASTSWDITTTQVFRDVSAWYHIVATFENGAVTLYVNNESIATASVSDTTYNFFTNIIHSIGGSTTGASNCDLYLAETHGIDGQALAPTNFGEFNDDGVWVPKAYAGTYGNNGFYITGEDSADLGADYSGNGNDFTSSGMTSDDQVTDTPTDNFATLNPLNMSAINGVTLKDGNLNADATGTATDVMATIFVNSGKYYVEYQINTADSSTSNPVTGIQGVGFPTSPKANIDRNGGYDYDGTTGTLSPAFTYTTSDVVMMAFDVDAKKIWFGKNGTWYNSGDPGAGTGETLSWAADGAVAPYVRSRNSSDVTVNFGQLGFDHPSPTGFSALSTANLPTPAIADGSAYFQTTLYTGTGSSLAVNQSGNSTFQPDFVWIKKRSGTDRHELEDAVRGVQLRLSSDRTDAEDTGGLTSFDSDGFTVDGSFGSSGESGFTYAAWQWLAGNGTASNTDGSTPSVCSVNATSGFSITTYTGTGALATVGHGLGAEPQFIAIKGRTNVDSWGVYPGTSTGYGGQYRLKLNETSPVLASSVYWNNTDATSSVFTVNTDAQVNGSGVDYVAYAFAEVEGFSKIGSYQGNLSTNGPFVYTGGRPTFLLIKNVTYAADWLLLDGNRSPYNVVDDYLHPNTTGAEGVNYAVDFLANGFKIRGGNTLHNQGTIIYFAIMGNPFGGDGVAPVPAR